MRYPLPAVWAAFTLFLAMLFGVAAPAQAFPSTSQASRMWTERSDRAIDPFAVRIRFGAERLFGGEYFDDDLEVDRYSGEFEAGWDFATADSLANFRVLIYAGLWNQETSRITIPSATLNQFPNSSDRINLDIFQQWVGAKVRAISTDNVVIPFLGRTPGRGHFDVGAAVMNRDWEESETLGRLDASFEFGVMIPGTIAGVTLAGEFWTGIEDGSFGQNFARLELNIDIVPLTWLKIKAQIYYQTLEIGDEFKDSGTTYESVLYAERMGVDLAFDLPYVQLVVGYSYLPEFRTRWGEAGRNSSRGEVEDDMHAVVFGLGGRF